MGIAPYYIRGQLIIKFQEKREEDDMRSDDVMMMCDDDVNKKDTNSCNTDTKRYRYYKNHVYNIQ